MYSMSFTAKYWKGFRKMKNKIDEAISKGEVYNAHRTYGKKRHFFSTEDLEFGFTYFLGHVTHGACAIGEMLYLVDQYDEKRPESWIEEAANIANRIENRARNSLKNHHKISARNGFLRASFFRRITTAMISPRKETVAWSSEFEKSRSLFKEAANLFEPAMEYFEVPF